MPAKIWKSETLVNSNTHETQDQSRVVALNDGGYVVVWTEFDALVSHGGDGSYSSVKMQRFDAAGNKVGAEQTVNTVANDAQLAPDVAVLNDGSIVVAWQDHSGHNDAASTIAYRRFSADGQPQGEQEWVSSGIEFQKPRISAAPDGGFVILADLAEQQGYYAWKFNAASGGGTLSAGIVTNAFLNEPALAVLADGRTVAAYTDSGAGTIVARISSSGGATSVTVTPTSHFGNGEPSIAALKNGGFVVTWTDETKTLGDTFDTAIHGRVFDSAGNAVGNAFRVSDLVTGFQTQSQVIALSNGGFAVVYHGFSNIRCSVFDANGQRVGTEFNVDVSEGLQNMPSVAELADGRLAFTYTDHFQYGLDGHAGGVVTKIFDTRDGSIWGTANAETIYGSADDTDDTIYGGGGADIIYGLGGNDTIYGGSGGDTIYGGAGKDILHGEGGNDTLVGGSGSDKLYGGLGNDILNGGAGKDLLDGGEGFDYASYADATTGVIARLDYPSQNTGEAAGDTYVSIEGLIGSAYADELHGDSGDNTLKGGGGRDTLYGGAGKDKLYGEAGSDYLYGGAGNDILIGGAGKDLLDGGEGFDYASYVDAKTGVIARLDNPSLNTGEAEGDIYVSIEGLIGSAHADELHGDGGDNTLKGGAGKDKLFGGAGNDKLFGDAGDDRLNGGSGDDILDGGEGKDRLTGGAGKDTFVFSTALGASNVDTITDFTSVDDMIQLSSSIFEGLAKGALKASAFKDIAMGSVDASDRILYDSTTGALYFDRDGSGSTYQPVQFAILENNAAISAADFFVV